MSWHKSLLLFFLFLPLAAAAGDTDSIPAVTPFDLPRYMGVWYEIARMPVRFEKDLTHVTATYRIKENGKVEVVNAGYKGGKNGKKSSVTGRAWIPDPKVPANLKVSFFLFFGATYKVIVLDQEYYNYAMVCGGDTGYLWILSRGPKLDPIIYRRLVDQASRWRFDVSQLIKVPQD